MSDLPSLPFRLVLVAGVLALGLTACGRRGALEAPPDPNAPKTEQTAQPAAGGVTPPVGQTSRRPQPIDIPKEPFILDPLL